MCICYVYFNILNDLLNRWEDVGGHIAASGRLQVCRVLKTHYIQAQTALDEKKKQ